MHRLLTALAALGALSLAPTPAFPQQDDPLQQVQRGRRLVADGRHAEGLALYEAALKARPQLAEAHLAAGIVLDLMGRYADARRHLTAAIEHAPAELKANALSAMAVSYAFERRTADAAGFYQQVFDLDVAAERPAGAASTANALGRLYLETGDTKKARQWYETGYEMARRQPDEPASQLALWQMRWLHAQGRIAAREGKAADARRFVEEARALVARSPSLKDEGPTVAYLAGYVALYTGDAAGARKALAGASNTDPFNLMLMAEAAEKTGDTAAAKDYWSRIVALNGHGIQHALSRPVAERRLKTP
jgi:tetratricopeptide (TPR) repeat protein